MIKGFWDIKFQRLGDFKIQGLRDLEIQRFRDLRIQECIDLGIHKFRDLEIKIRRNSGIQGFRDLGFRDLGIDLGIYKFFLPVTTVWDGLALPACHYGLGQAPACHCNLSVMFF